MEQLVKQRDLSLTDSTDVVGEKVNVSPMTLPGGFSPGVTLTGMPLISPGFFTIEIGSAVLAIFWILLTKKFNCARDGFNTFAGNSAGANTVVIRASPAACRTPSIRLTGDWMIDSRASLQPPVQRPTSPRYIPSCRPRARNIPIQCHQISN